MRFCFVLSRQVYDTSTASNEKICRAVKIGGGFVGIESLISVPQERAFSRRNGNWPKKIHGNRKSDRDVTNMNMLQALWLKV